MTRTARNVDINEDNLVVNGKGTYENIAEYLYDFNTAIFGWTNISLYNKVPLTILINYAPAKICHSRLTKEVEKSNLFVSIIGFGAYGFNLSNKKLEPSYIADKLNIQQINTPNVNYEDDLITQVADLINNVKLILYNIELEETDDKDVWEE